MSLRGVGIDVTDVGRIARLVEAHGVRFTRRWFAPTEIVECEANESPTDAFAVRFAVKEAVWKAIGIDWHGPVPWRSVAVLAADSGLTAELSGMVADMADESGVGRITVGVTARDGRAIALAIVEQATARTPSAVERRRSRL